MPSKTELEATVETLRQELADVRALSTALTKRLTQQDEELARRAAAAAPPPTLPPRPAYSRGRRYQILSNSES